MKGHLSCSETFCRQILLYINYEHFLIDSFLIVSPVRMYVRGYYGLVIVTPRPPPRPQTFHRSHDNLQNPYLIASILYM